MTPETAATSATPFVYLVAPDRHPDPDVSRHRHQAVQHATAYLTGQGQAVYSPNLVRRAWNAQYMPKPGGYSLHRKTLRFMMAAARFQE